jgi:transcription elongation factor S-II
MVQAILGTLMLNEDADEYWAKFLAFNIDRELNALFPDQKLYISKARSIAANLRNNQTLREQVYSGECNPKEIARMNPRELADKSVQEAIAQRKHDLEKGRQTDMYQELREKAQKAIGINAEGGEFTCSRCKGTKTSHYSMQTRSSDEPMTVFVTCLTCKKRWRE